VLKEIYLIALNIEKNFIINVNIIKKAQKDTTLMQRYIQRKPLWNIQRAHIKELFYSWDINTVVSQRPQV
jgi:hypothetical protein